MKLPTIVIRAKPFSQLRYQTCGDWQFSKEGDVLYVTVAESPDWRTDVAVAIHEAIEALMCKAAGVAEEDVDAFDLAYEQEREAGLHSEVDEAGDNHACPYGPMHKAATLVERAACDALGLSWYEHERNVERAVEVSEVSDHPPIPSEESGD